MTGLPVGAGLCHETPVEPAVAVAARQHGVVTTAQLAAAGLGRHAIAHRVRAGWLRRLHRGVYLVGPLTGPLTLEMAALLTCGVRRSALSFHTAAARWRVRAGSPALIHVSVTTHVRHRDGVRVHRVAELRDSDVTVLDGCRVTTPLRTLSDLAACLPAHDLARAVEEAQVLRLVTRAQLLALPPGRSSPALRRAVEAQHEPSLTRSEAERRLLALVRDARLPRPRTNAPLGRYEVDFLWPDQRLVVEVDGFAFHSTRAAFERDRLRDAELQAAGYRVIRVTWRQIAYEPQALIARLAAALARGR